MAGSPKPNPWQFRSKRRSDHEETEIGIRRTGGQSWNWSVCQLAASVLESIARHQPAVQVAIEQAFGAAGDLALRLDAAGAPRPDSGATPPDLSDTEASAAPIDHAEAHAAQFSGKELKERYDALLSAFHTRSSLARVLQFGLSRRLNEVAGQGPLEDVVFELLSKAQSEGWVSELFEASHAEFPGNTALRLIVAKQRAMVQRM